MVTVVQPFDYTESRSVVNFQVVNFMASELYLNLKRRHIKNIYMPLVSPLKKLTPPLYSI